MGQPVFGLRSNDGLDEILSPAMLQKTCKHKWRYTQEKYYFSSTNKLVV